MPYSSQPIVLLLLVVVPWLLLETWKSARQARALRAAGAIEAPDDVYRAMAVVYPGMFVAMTAEGVLVAPVACTTLVASGIGVFLAAKILKWWAILSLGRFWSFRVLVVPGATLVASGPYRWLRHPNYVGLLGEIAGVALMMRAPFTGVLSAIAFGALLVQRIRVEERLLAQAAGPR